MFAWTRSLLLFPCCAWATWVSSLQEVATTENDGEGEPYGLGASVGNYTNDSCPPEILLRYHCFKCEPCADGDGDPNPLVCLPYFDPDTGDVKQDLMCNISSCAERGYLTGPFMCLASPMTMSAFALSATCVVLWACWGCFTHLRLRVKRYYRWRRLQPPTPEAWIRAGPREYAQSDPYPSGRWRGHLTIGQGARFEVPEHQLDFSARGAVTGRGLDAGGSFTVSAGVHSSETRRVAYRKRYELGSKDRAGREVPEDVQGSVLEFRGQPAGADVGLGITGEWWAAGTARSGDFHVWPAVEGSVEYVPEFSASESFDVADGPCVVCYDREIDTKLAPCGHVAVCRLCAEQLPLPMRCPICRCAVDAALYCSAMRLTNNTSLFEDAA